ncbi:MAG: hypothetical protein V5A39_02460 [Haloarculaceae archaeon]
MVRYLLWFARLGRFYQIILTFALLVGLVAVAVSAATDSIVFLVVGICWLAGGSAVVWVADRRERR